MKKLRTILMSALCLLCIGGTFAGCGDNGTFSINQNKVEICVEEEFNLVPHISLTKLKIEDIDIVSLDPSVAIVSPDYRIIGVGAGETVVKLSYKENFKNLSVVVSEAPVSLDAPTGLYYDTQIGGLKWNEVFGSINGSSFKANEYTIAIKKQGENNFTETVVSNRTYFEIASAGTYIAKVKTNKRSDAVLESPYSNEFTFTILEKPKNLAFDKQTNTLSWEGDADLYYVSVNGTKFETTSKSYVLNLDQINTYEIFVIASEQNSIEARSEALRITKLSSPILSVVDGTLVWTSQTGVSKYAINISDTTGNISKTVEVAGNFISYKLSGDEYVANQEYVINITAIGGENYIDSENSNTITVTKLKKTELVFEEETKTLTVASSISNNAVVEVKVVKDAEEFVVYLNADNNYKYTFNREIGDYKLTATVLAPSEAFLNSDISSEVEIYILAPVTNLTHTVDSNNKGLITFNKTAHANKYEIVKVYNNEEDPNLSVQEIENGYNIGDVDGVFGTTGTYTLKINASNTTSGQDNKYYISSTQEIQIIRLDKTTLEKVGYKFNWTEVDNAVGYLYEFYKDGQLVETNTTNMLSFEFSSYYNQYGEYTFKVKAIGNNGNILDALNFVEGSHTEEYTLSNPVIDFNIETEILSILKNELADKIEVKLNEVEITSTNSDDDYFYYDLSSLIANSNTYVVKATAISNNELINASASSSLEIVRLNSLQEIKVNNNTISVEDYENADAVLQTKPYTLKVNNEETALLDNSNKFTVEFNYNGIGKLGNKYYLDSPVTTFTLNRLNKPTTPVYVEGNLISSISQVDNVLTYIVFNQGTTVVNKEFRITEGEFNLLNSDIFLNSNVNKDLTFSINIKYAFDGDIVVKANEEKDICSLNSETIYVSKLEQTTSLKLVKDTTNKIVWDAVEYAEGYVLSITKPDNAASTILTGNVTEYEYDFSNEGIYTVSLYATSSTYLKGNSKTIKVERLKTINSISVNESEVLSINNSVSSSKLSKVLVEIESSDITKQELTSNSLNSYTKDFKLYITNIARETEKDSFYISSATAEFSFTRISDISSVALSNNNISWVLNDDADKYMIKFEQGEKTQTLQVDKNTTSIALDDPRVEQIMVNFNEGAISVSVRPLCNPIAEMTAGKTGSLSCLNYSIATVAVAILEEATDLKIVASGELHNTVKLYFKHNLVGVKQINVYSNNVLLGSYASSTIITEELENQEYNVITFTNNEFAEEKIYNVKLIAVGSGGYVSSKDSEVITFTRLNKVNSSLISIDSNGILRWQNISNATGYKVFLKLYGKEVVEIDGSSNPLDIYSYLFDNGNLVCGDAEIQVRTLGNGVNYLNSQNSEVYTVNILERPTMEFGLDSIKVASSNSNVKIHFVVKKDTQIVAELDLNSGDTYVIPSNFEAGKYLVEIHSVSTLTSGVITSLKTAQEFVKLEEVSGYKFQKVNNGNDYYFRLLANKNANASGYVLTNNDYTTDTYSTSDDKIYYNILNELKQSIQTGLFTISVQAIGGVKNGVIYTNSNVSRITANKLPQVKDFTAFKTLTWTNSVYNNGYILRVNQDYIAINKDISTYELLDYTGTLNLNIRALGNVDYNGVSENAILDSDYIGEYQENVYVEQNISATKLEEISYLAVNDGYLALEYNSKYEYELIASNGISYYVSESQIIREEGSNIIKIFNDNMYRDFEADKAYTVKVRIIALDENILNSNISKLEISIQIPKNTMNPLWTLDELSTNKYNLANTKLTWEDLDKGNGYLVRLNGVAKNHDTNEYLVQDFEKGKYTFEVAIKGDNEKQNGVYLLTSKYSDSKTFYVLGETTVAVKNGQITWEAVENATKYYIYLNDKQTKYETKNTYLDESVIGEKIPVGTYTVSVQAVSETENYFQGKTADFVDKDKNKIQVIKLKSPKDLVLDKGVLKYTDALPSQNFGFISVPTSSETPFKYNVNINISDLASSNTNIINQILTYKFESQNGSVYHADVEAVNHVDISAYASLLKNFVSGSDAEFLEDYLQKVYGWPNYTRLFDEYAKHIPAGEYNMSVRQKGYDKDYYLTSDFGTERTVYIPYAPKINVTFDNGIYTLNISKVVIPEHITTEPIIYEVYGAYEEDGIRKYTLLQSSTNRQLNLTELVNNGTINDKFTDIFAFVKGNDTNILNGKTSNTIEVKVLTEVDASIQEGVVVWKSQTYASGFRISYVNSNTEEYSELVIDDISWLAEELQEGITYKDVKIQALGTENKQVTTLVISGPETEIGTITKLNSVNWYIENGVIYWTNIANSSKYNVFGLEGISDSIETSELKETLNTVFDGLVTFNPKLTDYQSYFIKTIGSENLELAKDTIGYVNSNFAKNLYTYKHTEVLNIKTVDGNLTFKTLDNFAGYKVGNYLITFESEGQETIVIELNSTEGKYTGYDIAYKYGTETYENLLAGNYSVYVQGFAKGHSINTNNNNNNFSNVVDGKTIYLLQSAKQKTGATVEKFNSVEDIIVTSISLDENRYTSSVTWTDIYSSQDAIYELTFTESSNAHTIIARSDDKDREGEFTYNSENNTWTFTGVINRDETLSGILTYKLKIRRLASNEEEMNSDYEVYYDEENDTDYIITQINPILETEIKLKDIDGKDYYVISWEDYEPVGLASKNVVSYLFEYYSVDSSGLKGEVRKIYVTGRQYVNYDTEIEQDSGTVMLAYRVQVLIGAKDSTIMYYTNSRLSKEFEIKTPNSVDNITYDDKTQQFTWEYSNTDTNNLVFIVKDYYTGTNNTPVLNLDNLTNYTRTEYTINVNKGKGTYFFAPEKIGSHIISIEVCVANFASSTIQGNEEFKSGAVFYKSEENENYNEIFDLFESGEGTENNPYIIKNAEQFENVNLRKVTPSYISHKYHFKQSVSLEIEANITYSEGEEYHGFITESFDGIYDADYNSIKVITTIYDLNRANGLFAKLENSAVIKNLQLLAEISGSVTSNVNTGLLTKVNNGKIDNIKVGNAGETGIKFESIENTIGFGFIASENNGTISNTVNYYNIELTHSKQYKLASVNIGAIVRDNYGRIENSGNNGNITISTYEGAVIGGIASKLDKTGVITSSYNKGTINITYNTVGSGYSTGSYYIGGIVGNITNDNAQVNNSYTDAKINVYHNNIDPTVYIGGIAGNVNLPNLVSNCYSNVTIGVAEVGTGISLSNLKYYLFIGNIKSSGQNTNLACYYLSNTSQSVAGGSGDTASSFVAQNKTSLDDIVTALNDAADGRLDANSISMFYLNGQKINLIVEQNLSANPWKK